MTKPISPISRIVQSPIRSVLNPARVAAPAVSLPPITAGLALWLAKGTASGATWPDSSGNARHMTLVGSPTIGASSVTFSGTGQYGTVAFTIGSPMTVCMRVKQVSWTSGRYLCAGATASTNRLWQAGVSPQIEQNDASLSNTGGGLPATLGATHSIVYTANVGIGLNGAVLNVDGAELIADAYAVSDPAMAGFTLAAGSSAGLSPSNIEVTEVVVYSVALDASQRATMNAYLDALP